MEDGQIPETPRGIQSECEERDSWRDETRQELIDEEEEDSKLSYHDRDRSPGKLYYNRTCGCEQCEEYRLWRSHRQEISLFKEALGNGNWSKFKQWLITENKAAWNSGPANPWRRNPRRTCDADRRNHAGRQGRDTRSENPLEKSGAESYHSRRETRDSWARVSAREQKTVGTEDDVKKDGCRSRERSWSSMEAGQRRDGWGHSDARREVPESSRRSSRESESPLDPRPELRDSREREDERSSYRECVPSTERVPLGASGKSSAVCEDKTMGGELRFPDLSRDQRHEEAGFKKKSEDSNWGRSYEDNNGSQNTIFYHKGRGKNARDEPLDDNPWSGRAYRDSNRELRDDGHRIDVNEKISRRRREDDGWTRSSQEENEVWSNKATAPSETSAKANRYSRWVPKAGDQGARDRDGPPRDRDGHGSFRNRDTDRNEPPKDRDGPPRDRDEPPRDRGEPPRDRDGPPRDRDGPPRDRDGPPRDRDGPPKDGTRSGSFRNRDTDRNEPPRDRDGDRGRNRDSRFGDKDKNGPIKDGDGDGDGDGEITRDKAGARDDDERGGNGVKGRDDSWNAEPGDGARNRSRNGTEIWKRTGEDRSWNTGTRDTEKRSKLKNGEDPWHNLGDRGSHRKVPLRSIQNTQPGTRDDDRGAKPRTSQPRDRDWDTKPRDVGAKGDSRFAEERDGHRERDSGRNYRGSDWNSRSLRARKDAPSAKTRDGDSTRSAKSKEGDGIKLRDINDKESVSSVDGKHARDRHANEEDRWSSRPEQSRWSARDSFPRDTLPRDGLPRDNPPRDNLPRWRGRNDVSSRGRHDEASRDHFRVDLRDGANRDRMRLKDHVDRPSPAARDEERVRDEERDRDGDRRNHSSRGGGRALHRFDSRWKGGRGNYRNGDRSTRRDTGAWADESGWGECQEQGAQPQSSAAWDTPDDECRACTPRRDGDEKQQAPTETMLTINEADSIPPGFESIRFHPETGQNRV